MTPAAGANLRAGSAGTTTRTFFLTERRRRLTAGSSDLHGLAFGPAPDYGCGQRRSRRSSRRRSLARATVRISQGDKISMSTSSSNGGSWNDKRRLRFHRRRLRLRRRRFHRTPWFRLVHLGQLARRLGLLFSDLHHHLFLSHSAGTPD